jgi:hypothetical protein
LDNKTFLLEIKMKAMLTRSGLYHFIGSVRTEGANKNMVGDTSGLFGNCSGISGDCSNINGDCSGLKGDVSDVKGKCTGIRGPTSGEKGSCSGISGNFNQCELSAADRAAGVDIALLIKP